MKPSVQPSVGKCERCGQTNPFVRESPYEFRYTCGCGSKRLISWAHASPPPTFETSQQLPLSETP